MLYILVDYMIRSVLFYSITCYSLLCYMILEHGASAPPLAGAAWRARDPYP